MEVHGNLLEVQIHGNPISLNHSYDFFYKKFSLGGEKGSILLVVQDEFFVANASAAVATAVGSPHRGNRTYCHYYVRNILPEIVLPHYVSACRYGPAAS